jgi:hypothetical protein
VFAIAAIVYTESIVNINLPINVVYVGMMRLACVRRSEMEHRRIFVLYRIVDSDIVISNHVGCYLCKFLLSFSVVRNFDLRFVEEV